MKFELNKYINKASVYYKNNLAYDVNNEFLELTGYIYNDIIGKSFEELMNLLGANFQIDFKEDKQEYNCYIFNKEDEIKDIKILQTKLSDNNGKMYSIIENKDELLKGILSTCNNNDENTKEAIAIFSYPEFIHLKFNKNYNQNMNLIKLNKNKIIGSVFKYPEYVFNSIGGKTSFYEKDREFIDKSGKITYWTVNSTLIFKDGKARYLRCSFYNETQNVVARKLLDKEKEKMEIILDNIPESVVMLNNKGEYTYTNKANRKKLEQYNECMFLDNKKVFKFFKYNDINGNELSFGETPDVRVLRGEVLKNYVIIGTSHLPTTYHECNGIPTYDEQGNVDGAILIYRDIEDALKLNEYDALSKNMKSLEVRYATLKYEDLEIKYINNNGFKAIKKGYPNIKSLPQLIGKNFFYFYNSDENFNASLELISDIKYHIENEKTPYIHIKSFEEDEKDKYVKTIFEPVYDKEHNIKEINAIGMDITDEKTIGQKMKKALEAQEEIFINTSHELKTPLNLVYSASQLIDLYLKDHSIENKKNEILKNNKIIMQNCYRLIKLINNILDTSKIEKGFYQLSLENANIVNIIENIVQSTAHYVKSKGLKIIFDSDIEEKIMAFDIYKIERVMLNLISNAIKFSNIKGTIVVNLVDKDDFIEISVIDDGIGIDQEDRNEIFNKFIQVNKSLNRKVEGTGIGLSLVKSIIDLHRGKISVDSTLGLGSKFTIQLPLRTVDSPIVEREEYCHDDIVEMIRLEMSDIYT